MFSSSCLLSPSSNFLVSVLAFNFVFMGETSWESISEAGTTSSSSLGSPRVRKLNSRGRQRLFSFPLGEEMAGGGCPEAAGLYALFVPVATLTVVPCPSGGCGIRGLFSDSHFISIHAKTAAKKLWNSKPLQGMQKLRLLALPIPCSLRKCPHKDPGEEGHEDFHVLLQRKVLSLFQKHGANGPTTKFAGKEILMGSDFIIQIHNRWKGKLGSTQTRTQGQKRRK